jgi:CotH kinase protein
MPRWRLTAIAIFMVTVAAVVPGAQWSRPQLLGLGPPPNADALFDDTVVQEIRLVVNSTDWQRLKDHYLENTYYPADLQWGGLTVRNVGIRQRGTGSRSPVKPGLFVDFERYVTGQRFLGLKGLVLRNNTQDASNLHERVSMLFFRRMGLPAPREAHMTLYVNNEYVGLYTVVEAIDEMFLQRALGENQGYLFSYDYPADAQPYYFDYRGSSPDLYVPLPFKPENHKDDPQPEVIERIVSTINESSDAAFRTAIAEYLDLSKFIRFVAIENFIADNDGFMGDWGMNNFYWYRFAGTNLFTFLPWDKSEAFKNPFTYSIFHNITGVPAAQQNRLMARALSYPDLYNLYLDTMLECVSSADAPDPAQLGSAGWLEREIDREYQQIQAAALADTFKPYTNDEFQAAITDAEVFARHRGEAVTVEVDHAR